MYSNQNQQGHYFIIIDIIKFIDVFLITPRGPSVFDVIDVIPVGGFKKSFFSCSFGNKPDTVLVVVVPWADEWLFIFSSFD